MYQNKFYIMIFLWKYIISVHSILTLRYHNVKFYYNIKDYFILIKSNFLKNNNIGH